jgi:hypothetical protein
MEGREMQITENNRTSVLRHARECLVTARDAERIGWGDVGASLRRMARECLEAIKQHQKGGA